MHLRKSRADLEAEARGEGESLARHERRLRDFANRMHLEITAVYREIISGDKLAERPEMQRLLADVASGLYDGVLTVEVSRLTRGDLMDQGRILNTFKFSSTKIVTPEHTYDLMEDWDEDVITSDMMMARREYKYIKRRLQRGRLASATEGLWQGPAPFGYRRVKIPRGKGWTLTPDPDQAPLVQMIYTMYAAEHVGGARIAQRLNDLGSRTTRGNAWTADTVVNLVQNPVYRGCVRWNDRVSVTRMVDGLPVTRREKCASPLVSPGKHPPLVSSALWEAAQQARRAHDLTRNHRDLPVRNPLAGLVFCAVCGRAMTRKEGASARGSACALLRCPRSGCPTVSSPLALVESAVLEALAAWPARPSLRSEQPSGEKPSASSAARAALTRLLAQRERIFAAYEDGAYDAETFAQRRAAKEAEIDAARAALAAIERGDSPEPGADVPLPQVRSLPDVYRLARDPAGQNRLLKTVLARVEYRKTARGRRGQSSASALSLTLYPKWTAESPPGDSGIT